MYETPYLLISLTYSIEHLLSPLTVNPTRRATCCGETCSKEAAESSSNNSSRYLATKSCASGLPRMF